MLTTLQGLKVLDFGLYFAGPYASRLLADLGADVIKLEALDGDTLRPTTKPFNAAARGKRSIAVDLKTDAGREVAHRIAAHADVVTHNMRPGVAERLGMGYETIRSLNPEVIYSYAPGWGSSGPDAARSGFAPLFSGFVGLHHESAGEGNIPTSPPGNEDNGNGLLGAAAILFALYHRAQTGKGQYLEHPQLNATMLMGLHLMRGADGSVVGSMGLDHERHGVHPLDRLYRTADGWLCISARTDAEFARLSGVPAFAELRDDPRFVDGDARLAHRTDLEAVLTAVFATATHRSVGRRPGGGGRGVRGAGGTGAAVADPGRSRAGSARAGRAVRASTVGPGLRHRGHGEDGRRAVGSREARTRDRSTHARGAGRIRLRPQRHRLAVRPGSGALTSATSDSHDP